MFVSNVETGLRFAIADDRLRREVEHRVDLVLAERALEQRLIADVAADDLDALEQAAAHELGLRHPVAHEADDVGACARASRRTQPAADQAGARR